MTTLQEMKSKGEKIAMLTAYDFSLARVVDEAGIDIILVGDSASNVMAGHAVIKVFAGFAAIAVISPVSIVAITAMYGLEILVAFIQAYVFTILTCVYLKDALHPSH